MKYRLDWYILFYLHSCLQSVGKVRHIVYQVYQVLIDLTSTSLV